MESRILSPDVDHFWLNGQGELDPVKILRSRMDQAYFSNLGVSMPTRKLAAAILLRAVNHIIRREQREQFT